MDIAYLHIITNHIPIIGVPFALFLLALGIRRKSDELKTASFLIFVFLGIATLGTFLLGQGGEDFVEDLAGVSEQAIENHEDFARFALASVAVTALVSLFAFVRYRGFSFLKRRNVKKDESTETVEPAGKFSNYPNWIGFAVLVLALASGAILGYTGKLGGKIRHTEFYGGASPEEEKDGKNRRGKTDQRPEKNPPVADTETNTTDAEQDTEESGKKRRRGGRN
jgi:hypothetical protein